MEPNVVRAKVTRQRDFRAFAELSHAQWVILENARLGREGWFYECLSANVLAVFKLEAYLNHIGPLIFSHWSGRNTSNEAKLNRVLNQLRIKKDRMDDRYMTLMKLFRFRNDVAHAKTESLQTRESIEEGDIETIRRRRPLTEWEKLCTIEFATQAFEHTESIIREIHDRSGRPEVELWQAGHSYTLQVLDEITPSCS